MDKADKAEKQISEEKDIREVAREMARAVRTPAELDALTKELYKGFFEAALAGEMDEHLGYEAYAAEGRGSGNSRNGHTAKTLRTPQGDLELRVPRDRDASFEPRIVAKRQRRLDVLDEKVRALYAAGLSTREVSRIIEDLYGVEVSSGTVTRVTEAVLAEVREWQARPLDPVCTVLYLDCIVMKVRGEDGRVANKAVYLALGIGLDGRKELLGMWISKNEGARFWLSVLTDLRARGLEQVLIACVDGLTGFPEAIEAVYPQARVQLCLVHMVRNTLRFVGSKHQKKCAAGLRRVYNAPTEAAGLAELDAFAAEWEPLYPEIAMGWREKWVNLAVMFHFPEEIRKVIYTTNAIESLNSVIRKVVRKRKVFPSDDAAFKTVFLVAGDAATRWKRPVANWNAALNRFRIEFGEQIAQYL